jgi:hypothetical protein
VYLLLLTHHVFQPLTESFVPFGIATRRGFRFQSIPKLSKSALSNRFLSFPPLDFKHPDTLFLTYPSIPICYHSFQIRQVWYCYLLNEFFIPSPFLSVRFENSWDVIANTSFVSGIWPIRSKSVRFGIATLLTNSSSPACIATWWEFLKCYC